MKWPELAEECARIKFFVVTGTHTAAEAAEIDLRPGGRSPGILSYREHSAPAKIKFAERCEMGLRPGGVATDAPQGFPESLRVQYLEHEISLYNEN